MQIKDRNKYLDEFHLFYDHFSLSGFKIQSLIRINKWFVLYLTSLKIGNTKVHTN
jgi:hypothetical protein